MTKRPQKKTTRARRKPFARKIEPEPDAQGHYSFADAAHVIMQDAGNPMHYANITEDAIKRELIVTEAKSPAVGMYISMRNDIKRRAQTGQPQRFYFHGAGRFSLAEILLQPGRKEEKTVFERVSESRQEASNLLYQRLTSRNQGENFELLISDLLTAMGYEDVEVIGGKDDQGVDIICSKRDGLSRTRIAVQCKCKTLKNEIGPKDISNLRDNLSTYQCQAGVFITTSKLNAKAKTKTTEAGKERIHCIEHDELLGLLAEHHIGLKAEPVVYYQVDTDQYEFLK